MIGRRRQRGARIMAVVMTVAVCVAVPHAQAPAAVDALRAEVERLTAARDWTALAGVLERLRDEARQNGDTLLEADTLRRLGLTHQQLKAYPDAREAFDAALAIYAAAGNRLGAAQLHDDLGLLAWTMGDAPGVRTHYGMAADLYAAAGRPERQVNSLRNVTFASDMSLDDRVAIVERALALADATGDLKLEGLTRHQLGDLLNMRGDYDRAIGLLEASVPLLESDSSRQAAALTSLGRTYRLHGLPNRAIEIYQRLVPMLERADDARGLAQALDAMGVALWSAGRRTEAVQAQEQAVDIARRAGLDDNVAFYTNNVAANLTELGQHARAIALLEPLMTRSPGPAFDLLARHTLADAYRGLGKLADARGEIDGALAACEKAGDREQLVRVLSFRASLRREMHDVPGAMADAGRALDELEALRAKAAPRDEMKRSFVDAHRELFALAIALARDAGEAVAAFEIAERARARAFRDLIATHSLAPADDSHPGALPSGVAVPPPRMDDVAARVRALHTTLLAYWVTPDDTTIWVVDGVGHVTATRVNVKASRFEELARQISPASSAPPARSERPAEASSLLPARSGASVALGKDPRPALAELHRLLVAPVEAALPRDEGSLLTIVRHGPLFGVPFAALVDNRGRYLIETYRLHYVTSAALLQAPPSAPSARRGVLLVADPTPMPRAEGRPLPPLPGARREVRAVAGLLPRGSAQVLVGADATESRVRLAETDQRAVHFATHGIMFDDRPFDSFLALAPDPQGDGRLTTSDIYQSAIHADLVVLSGCRTATGELTGDGVQGLARAFFYAGATSVIATLWDLPDAPAEFLFPEFYRRWMAGDERSAALRRAQLSLIRALRQGRVAVATPLGEVTLPEHPVIWAGALLLGQP